MNLPEGRLVRSRVVEDPARALSSALDRELTGVAVFEPQDALLLDAESAGVIRFRSGVPVAAHHAGTGREGPAALADLAVPGPYSVELHAVDPDRLGGERTDREVPPGMAAERLGGDHDLARRTRERSRSEGVVDAEPPREGTGGHPERDGSDGTVPRDGDATPETDTVEAFLDDEERIAALKEQARERAKERAGEWGIEDQLSDDLE
jgi:hypothetical protein